MKNPNKKLRNAIHSILIVLVMLALVFSDHMIYEFTDFDSLESANIFVKIVYLVGLSFLAILQVEGFLGIQAKIGKRINRNQEDI